MIELGTKAWRLLLHLPVLLAMALGACGSIGSGSLGPQGEEAAITLQMQKPADIKYYPSDEPLRLGVEHFNRGNYGLAEQYFRDAVEKAPEDAEAWVGLAASYDRLARFDLADRAYRNAIALSGETTQILNNQGYSYMLRGDLRTARSKFLMANALEPENATIVNNIQLLEGSDKYIRREGPE